MSTLQEDLDKLRSRPRFKVSIPYPPDNVIQKLKELPQNSPFRSTVATHHVFIKVPENDEHFWSPQLSLEIEAQGAKYSLVRGLYGPKPSIWTMFMFFYAILAFATLGFALWGLTQLTLNQSPWPLWLSLGTIAGIAALYAVSHLGKKLGYAQIVALHTQLLKSLQ